MKEVQDKLSELAKELGASRLKIGMVRMSKSVFMTEIEAWDSDRGHLGIGYSISQAINDLRESMK